MNVYLIKFFYPNDEESVWHLTKEYTLIMSIDFNAACKEIKKKYPKAKGFENMTIGGITL